MSRFKSSQPPAVATQPVLPPRTFAPLIPAAAAPVNPPRVKALLADPPLNALQKIGWVFGLIYLFALFSLSTEVVYRTFGIKPYITIVAGPVAFLAAILSGHVTAALKSRVGQSFTAFVLWCLLSVPFSIFKMGSVTLLQEFITKNYPIILLLPAVVIGLNQIRHFALMIVWSSLVLCLTSLKFGGLSIEGRFGIMNTTLENPNDFATHLLLTLPFCLMLFLTSSRTSPARWLSLATAVSVLLTAMRCGSRGAMMAFLSMLIVLFSKSSHTQRAILAVVTLAGLFAAGALLPRNVWARYLTVFTPAATGEDADTLAMAVSSSNSRKYLFERSIAYTFQNPILGVGPGNFIVREAKEATESGSRGSWLGTHNSYTQASSETGIPGFLFFTGTILGCVWISAGIHKRSKRFPRLLPLQHIALGLLMSVVGFGVDILFSHFAYWYYVPVLAGITIAFANIARPMLDEEERNVGRARA